MHRLFNDFAHRYDLHTPPHHYRHDHAFVLDMAKTLGDPCRLLDVGCGTGVLIQKAREAGILATGIDASPAMVCAAKARSGEGAAAVCRMQDIDDVAAYDLVVSLSWTLNYCADRADLLGVLRRIHRAVRPGGQVLLQVAHSAHTNGQLVEDREVGPGGEPDDVVFFYRFAPMAGEDASMRAEYSYACKSLNELMYEQHVLRLADAHEVARCVGEVGFSNVQLHDSWRRDAFRSSPSPFVSATRESGR